MLKDFTTNADEGNSSLDYWLRDPTETYTSNVLMSHWMNKCSLLLHLSKSTVKPGTFSSRLSTRKMTTSSTNSIAPQDFHYFLVLDFEATCARDINPDPQEIIEFPVLKVSGKTFEVKSQFHSYVQPQCHGISEFCTELTGITQEMVDGQPTLEEVLKMFDEWMTKEGLRDQGTKSIFVTCGDWDLKSMLPRHCQYLNIQVPAYFKQWINIKKPFAAVTGIFPRSFMSMLEMLNLPHQGRHHSGIDDSLNIANILKTLAERKYRFSPTGAKK